MTISTGETLIYQTIGKQALVSASIPLQDMSLLDVLSRFPAGPRLYWRFDAASPAYAGVGVAAAITGSGPGRFEQVRRSLRELFSGAAHPADIPAPARPRVIGGFSYDPAFVSHGIWSAFPSALFILPRYQLASFENQTWLTANLLIDEGDALRTDDLLRAAVNDFQAEARPRPNGHHAGPPALEIDYPMGADAWASIVAEAVQRIRRGELEKVVLARVAEAHADRPIDTPRVLAALDERYPDCCRFLIEPEPGSAFFGATPELLVTIDGRQVTTGALAGSTPRGATPDEDAALGEGLLASAKNRHEHAVVVRDIAERLSPLTADLRVGEQPSLRRFQNIQHLHTPISGHLAGGVDALNLVEALHPTPALGGTPREVAARVIAELEPQPRGWYGAPVGWLDGDGNGQFAVAIRSAVSAGADARLYSGAGIVADSVAESEWQETSWKFRPLLDALSAGRAG